MGSQGAGGGGAGIGGAVFNDGGTLTVENATLSGNSALGGTGANAGQGLGGGIFARNGTVNIHNATLNNNTAAQGGGSLYLLGDGQVVRTGDPTSVTYSVTNTILANTPDGASDAFVDAINDGAATTTSTTTNNLVETNSGLLGVTQMGDPNLGPLTDANGGSTETHALCTAAGVPDAACTDQSPAIDAGDNAAVGALTTDQRGTGFDRVSGGQCVVDIGAFEVQATCNQAPVAAADAYSHFGSDTPLVVAAPGVLGNDTDDGGLTAVRVSGPSSGTLTLNADGSFTYQPNEDFLGTDSFTYKANDGTADSNVATVTITVGAGCKGRQATRVGTSASQVLTGTAGDDVIAGQGGNDALLGLGGNDTLCGGSGLDALLGSSGNDHLDGGSRNDALVGGVGNDTLLGGAAADALDGGADADTLAGGAGSPDVCVGGAGTDSLAPGHGCERVTGIP